MGEANITSTNGALHATPSADSTALGNPDDKPPIAGFTQIEAIEKPSCPHTLSAQHVAELFKSDTENGLSSEEAASRLTRDGPNTIKGAKGLSLWQIFLAQVANALTVVLIAVAALSFAISDFIEGGVVVAVIVLNIVVGYVICKAHAPSCVRIASVLSVSPIPPPPILCFQGMPRTRNPFSPFPLLNPPLKRALLVAYKCSKRCQKKPRLLPTQSTSSRSLNIWSGVVWNQMRGVRRGGNGGGKENYVDEAAYMKCIRDPQQRPKRKREGCRVRGRTLQLRPIFGATLFANP
jgi:hypothetical protein